MGRESGGELPQPTAGAAGRDAVPLSLELSDGDDGSRACSGGAGTAKDNAMESMAF